MSDPLLLEPIMIGLPELVASCHELITSVGIVPPFGLHPGSYQRAGSNVLVLPSIDYHELPANIEIITDNNGPAQEGRVLFDIVYVNGEGRGVNKSTLCVIPSIRQVQVRVIMQRDYPIDHGSFTMLFGPMGISMLRYPVEAAGFTEAAMTTCADDGQSRASLANSSINHALLAIGSLKS